MSGDAIKSAGIYEASVFFIVDRVSSAERLRLTKYHIIFFSRFTCWRYNILTARDVTKFEFDNVQTSNVYIRFKIRCFKRLVVECKFVEKSLFHDCFRTVPDSQRAQRNFFLSNAHKLQLLNSTQLYCDTLAAEVPRSSLESRHRPTGGRWFTVQISRGPKIKMGSCDLGL